MFADVDHPLVRPSRSTPDDTKIVYKREFSRTRFWLEVLRSLTAVEYLYRAVDALRRDHREARTEQAGPRPFAALPQILVTQAVLFAGFAFLNPWLYFGLWLLPMATVEELLHKLRAATEHHPVGGEAGSALGSGF